jgi:hypothetical protein
MKIPSFEKSCARQNIILDNLKIRSKPTVLYVSSIETLYDNHQLEC